MAESLLNSATPTFCLLLIRSLPPVFLGLPAQPTSECPPSYFLPQLLARFRLRIFTMLLEVGNGVCDTAAYVCLRVAKYYHGPVHLLPNVFFSFSFLFSPFPHMPPARAEISGLLFIILFMVGTPSCWLHFCLESPLALVYIERSDW